MSGLTIILSNEEQVKEEAEKGGFERQSENRISVPDALTDPNPKGKGGLRF